MSTKQTVAWIAFLVIVFVAIVSQMGASSSVTPTPSDTSANIVPRREPEKTYQRDYAKESALDEICAKQLHETELYGSRAEYRIVVGGCEQAKASIRSGR